MKKYRKGFAVVASSIQTLAGESDSSAKEIQNIINEIILKSQNNVQLANQIKNAIDSEGDALILGCDFLLPF